MPCGGFGMIMCRTIEAPKIKAHNFYIIRPRKEPHQKKKKKKKKLERKSGKKIIIKPLIRPKSNANRKAQYKINLISN